MTLKQAEKCGCRDVYQPVDFTCPRCDNKGYIVVPVREPEGVHCTKLADGDVWVEGRLSDVLSAFGEKL